MKKILSVALILVAILAAAPFVNGLMMEKTLRSQVDRINEIYADRPFSPQIEITRYDRGFASSEIEFLCTIPQMQGLEGDITLILTESAKHGFIGVSSTTSLSQNSWYSEFINDSLNGQDPLSITSQFTPFSGITSTVALESFEVDVDGDLVLFSPGELIMKTDPALKHLVADGHFDGFASPGIMDIRDITLSSDLTLISDIIMDGESTFTVGTINLGDSSRDKRVELSSLKGSSTIDYDDSSKTLSTQVKYTIDKVVADNEEINTIRLTAGINQLDAEGLENFYTAYCDMMNEMLANLAAMQNDPQQAEEMMAQQFAMIGIALLPELEKLLKKDLQIEISDFHMALPQGEVEGNFAIGLKNDMTLASIATLTQQPEKLVDVFSFTSNFTLPDGLIPDQESLLIPLLPGMQSGVFEQKDDKLVHTAQVMDDKLLLNGKEFVLRQ
nr:DUF945 family protein [uncultured Desulfuromonas sp.]